MPTVQRWNRRIGLCPAGEGGCACGINSRLSHPLRRVQWLLCALLAASTGPASTPALEQTDLFTEHTDGFVSYRIPGLVVTARGTVLAYGEARKYSGADWGEIEVHLRRSTDGGRTFAPARQVAHLGPRLPRHPVLAEHPRGNHGGPAEQTVNNPVAIATREGPVHLLYCVEYQRAFHVRSDDDGLTWTEPVEITGALAGFRAAWPWRVLALGPGHGLQLQSGRLLVPVWIALAEGSPHGRAVSATIVSDDGGRTWRAGAIAVPNDDSTPSPSEAIATELPGGRVLLLARTRSAAHRKVATVSPDGASGWSRPEVVPDLVEPICMSGLITLPDAAGRPSATVVHSNPDHLGVAGREPRPG
ncbi:MAG: sialidase family protein, partial [Opitutaceae bacterium]